MAKKYEAPSEDQLRIGDELPEPERAVEAPRVPPALQISADQERRIDLLRETQGHEEAILHTLPRRQAERVIGHRHLSDMSARLDESIRARQTAEAEPSRTPEEVLELMQDTFKKPEDNQQQSSAPADQAD